MRRLSFRLIIALLFSSLTSGCIGFGVVTPTECRADIPLNNYIYEKDKWGPLPKEMTSEQDEFSEKNYLPEKDVFRQIWGEPDEIIHLSEDEETFVYKRKIWCGAIPAYIVMLPLILPTCEGFDRITFKGNAAKHIHFRREDGYGFIFPAAAGGSIPCPNQTEGPKNTGQR